MKQEELNLNFLRENIIKMKNIGDKTFWNNLRGKLINSKEKDIIELQGVNENILEDVMGYISVNHYNKVSFLKWSKEGYYLHILNVGVPANA